MIKELTEDEIDPKVKSKVYLQSYEESQTIEGVKITEIVNNVGEEGDFSEILRFNDRGGAEKFPDFKLAQINRTRLNIGTVKAWHLHLKQDEIWYIMPQDFLFVGLWDVRVKSKTNGVVMRVILGAAKRLLFIPRGVAHGCLNIQENPLNLFYFTNQRFNRKNPDELRIHWDALGEEFWSPKRD